MVRRVVDTVFWTDAEVIDSYSIEDKYFSLYLMTNEKNDPAGIYPLAKKVMSFETGFEVEWIEIFLSDLKKVINVFCIVLKLRK